MRVLQRLTTRTRLVSHLPLNYSHQPSHRTFHLSRSLRQQQQQHEFQQLSDPHAHRNFYRSHGRALFKALTLAFLTYQIVYWAWLVVETEDLKAQTNREIVSLETEVKALDERNRTGRTDADKRLLEVK